MGFLEAVRTCLFRKYLDFRGRAPRAEYWWFQVFVYVAVAAPNLFDSTALAHAVIGVTVVPRLAVTVRRLHDTDRSAWWLLLEAPGWVGFLLDDHLDSVGDFASFVFLLVWAIPSLVMFWFMVQKGDAWENRYGPDPVPDAVLGLSRVRGPTSENQD